MKRLQLHKVILLLIPVLSLAMHLRVFSLDLIGYHVWRQTETQTVINNFYKEDFNILVPKINDGADTDRVFRMEFPVMQWIFALFHHLLGDQVMISRILSFITGLFTVYGMFNLLQIIIKDKTIAAIGAWAFNFSPLFYYYTVNPIPDNLALCCAVWSLVFLLQWLNEQNLSFIVISALLFGVATMAKLPFIIYGAFIISILLIHFKMNDTAEWKKLIQQLFLYFIFILPAAMWYSWVIPTWKGNGVMAGITDYSTCPYPFLDLVQFHLISTLPELLVNYGSLLFFLAGIWFVIKGKTWTRPYFTAYTMWGLAVIAYFIFEINMIQRVHDYYLMPFLPLIFILVTYGIYHLLSNKKRLVKNFAFLLLFILPVTAYLRANSRWDENKTGFTNDLYKYKNELRALVPSSSYCIAGNDDSRFIFLYYIDKKGWTYSNNDLTETRLKEWIGKGAEYIYVDSKIDTIQSLNRHFKNKIFDQGEIRVYALK